MKRWKKALILIVALAVVGVLVSSYMHVSGEEIADVSDISTDCIVVVDKLTYHLERTTYTLRPEQIEAFRDLILNTSFTMTFADTYRYVDRLDTYSAYVSFPDSRPNLHIEAVGNQAISVMGRFHGWMAIDNADWEDTLLQILGESGTSQS